jgi:predicted nucleotidyltransferase
VRNNGALRALFPSIRRGVLSATWLQPERWWFMTELARHLEVTPSSLQRELESLVNVGVLVRRQDGRRAYFKANVESPLSPELRGLIEKTAGIVPALKQAVQKFDKRIDLALVYGSIARGEERAGSDVDLLVVGKLRQMDLLPQLRSLETHFGREINAVLFAPEEFRAKLSNQDHFLRSVLKGKTILLKGTPDGLEKPAR